MSTIGKKWNSEEDLVLKKLTKKHPGNWALISGKFNKKTGLSRNSNQCRERFINHLDENIIKSPFDEKELIKLLVLSKKTHTWTDMTKFFPGRSPNQLKNTFYATERKIKKFNWHVNKSYGNSDAKPLPRETFSRDPVIQRSVYSSVPREMQSSFRVQIRVPLRKEIAAPIVRERQESQNPKCSIGILAQVSSELYIKLKQQNM